MPMPRMYYDDWISVPEAARILGLTPARIYQMIKEKKLGSTTYWGKVLVSRSQVAGMLAKEKVS